MRILVVDDEPSIREIFEIVLKADGHIVETAGDGESGLDRFRGGEWDVVLVDRCMPGMSGGDLAAAIKALEPRMPVVLVSGCPELDYAAEGKLSAVDVIVRKPFTMATLRCGMAEAFKLRQTA